MRDGSQPRPEPPSDAEMAAFARSILAGKEHHVGAQAQLRTLAEWGLRLYERRPPSRPPLITEGKGGLT